MVINAINDSPRGQSGMHEQSHIFSLLHFQWRFNLVTERSKTGVTCYLQVFNELAGGVAGQPLDRRHPDGLSDVAEEGNDEVGGGQVRDEQVDGGPSSAHPVHASQRRRVADECDDEHDRQDGRLHDGQLRRSRCLRRQAAHDRLASVDRRL